MEQAPPNIVLAGFMGCGKTTVGLLLAERLDRPFVDMDAELEARTGKTIEQLFAAEGEAAFRQREGRLSGQLASVGGLIIACGGGTLLNDESLSALNRSGRIVCLDATLASVQARLAGATDRPLLLAADGTPDGARIAQLWRQRRHHYEGFARRVDTSDLSPEAVADAVVALLLGAD